ncbi:MAG: Recombinase [Microgenomates group bacterium Gr01-1014_7]|nr:MAG: Recombinase [Microgenomates group bacterium Gr01-1014_7]
MKTCYIYIRVSTEEQKNSGYSPDNQIRHCREYAQMNKYQVKRIFDDSGKSGRSAEKRPALQELLKAISEHPVDAIIIYKIDRFARNVGDFDRMYKDLKAKGIKLLSINEGDLTEGNSLIPNIFASVAQWESEVNGERTRDALAQKFEGGWQPSPLYIGYRSVGGEDEKKTCEPDPYVTPIIKELFELYATGNYSILALQEWLSKKNIISRQGTPLGHSVINNILRNPFYWGLIRWHGESKIGKHQPIISKQLYDVCQYTLAKHRSFLLRRRVHDFLLRGFAYCAECGQRYTAEWHKDAKKLKTRGGKIAYYHCQKRERNGCPAPYIELSDLEEQVEQQFKKMEFSEEFISAVVRKTKEVLEENRRLASSNTQGILNQKNALEARRNTLEDVLLDGTIDKESYKRRHDDLQQQIINLDNQIIELDNKAKIDIDLIEEVLAFTRNIHQAYVEAPTFLKRHYLRFFFEQIVIKNKKIYKVVPTPIFKILKNRHEIIIRQSGLPR